MSETVKKDNEVAVDSSQPDAVLLKWQSHPAKARPIAAVLVSIFLIICVVIVYDLTQSPLFAAIGALILWGSLSQFYLSTEFEFSEKKVRVRYLVNKIEKEWTQYRSYYEDKNGVLLSPFVRQSRLETFRGIYIRFAGNRDEVMDVVKSKIKKIEDPA